MQPASRSLDAEHVHLAQIERTCQDLTQLVERMTDTARLEAGQMPVVSGPLLLGDS